MKVYSEHCTQNSEHC